MKKYLTKISLLTLALAGLASCNNGESPIPADSEKVLDHLIIEEVYYSGSWNKVWKQAYDEDQYIKITNPTDKTLYLDGMALATSGLESNKIRNLKEGTDHRQTHFGASILLRFPGQVNGTTLPILPGKSVYLAKAAYNHTVESDEFLYNVDSYDLSNVNFEWATKGQIEVEGNIQENPNVPNLIPVYPTEREDDPSTPPHLIPEFGALALVKIPAEVSNEILLSNKEYEWHTRWTSSERVDGGVSGSGGGHSYNSEYDPIVFLKLPNAWIVDAVQICPQLDFQWSVVADGIDKGKCSVYPSYDAKLKNRQESTNKAIVRKYDGKKFVDTNNSDVDFEVKAASAPKSSAVVTQK